MGTLSIYLRLGWCALELTSRPCPVAELDIRRAIQQITPRNNARGRFGIRQVIHTVMAARIRNTYMSVGSLVKPADDMGFLHASHGHQTDQGVICLLDMRINVT